MQSLISKSLLEEYYINQNKSSIEIAKELNVSSSWIQKLIREYNIQKHIGAREYYGDEYIKQSLKLFYIDQGLTIKQVAEKFTTDKIFVGESLVKIWLREFDIHKGRNKVKELTPDDIKYFYEEMSLDVDDIAVRLNCSRGKIYDLIRQGGLERKEEKSINQKIKQQEKEENEKILLEKIYELYINQNMSAEAVAKEVGLYVSTVLRKLKKNNIVKSKEMKKACREATTIKKIGRTYAMHSPEAIKQREKNYFEKTGYINPNYNPEVLKKRAENYKKKTGYSNSMYNPDIVQKRIEKMIEENGVPYAAMLPQCRQASKQTRSQINKVWQHKLNINDEDTEFNINKFSYDMKKDNIMIEINPSFTHNSTYAIPWSKKQEPMDKNYHFNKLKNANDSGYDMFCVWDWDDMEKIVNFFKNKQTVYARETIIKEVSEKECNEFLNQYHFQNTCRGQSIRLGLYKDDQLLEIMTFGKPRYNSKFQYELLRLCSKPGFVIVGGASKLFKYFLDNYKPESIISYCDLAKFSGKVYESLGMKRFGESRPSCHWYNIKTHQHITDNLLRQRGADQLLGTKDGKGTSNKEIMIREGFVEVYDCGQATYVWKV